jgi:hypothetical protein
MFLCQTAFESMYHLSLEPKVVHRSLNFESISFRFNCSNQNLLSYDFNRFQYCCIYRNLFNEHASSIGHCFTNIYRNLSNEHASSTGLRFHYTFNLLLYELFLSRSGVGGRGFTNLNVYLFTKTAYEYTCVLAHANQ